MDVWVVVDVGCIECGQETHIIGVFQRADDAKKAFESQRAKEDAEGDGSYFAGGQRQLLVLKTTLSVAT